MGTKALLFTAKVSALLVLHSELLQKSIYHHATARTSVAVQTPKHALTYHEYLFWRRAIQFQAISLWQAGFSLNMVFLSVLLAIFNE